MPPDLDATVEADLDRLRSMAIVELGALWQAKFKCDPPKAFGPDLLRRSLAYRIQENAYGGLDLVTARLLNRSVAQHTKNPGKIVLPRRLKSGVLLVREWKHHSHRVTVSCDTSVGWTTLVGASSYSGCRPSPNIQYGISLQL